MSKVIQVRELIQKAHDIRQSSTGLYRAFQEQFIEDKLKIQQNRTYSDEGKRSLTESLVKRKSVELLQLTRSQKELYQHYLKQAKGIADGLAFAKPPKVDPEKEDRFNKRLAELQTELLLATSADSGKKKLESFIGTIDEHAFAVKVKGQFAELVTPILAAAGPDGTRYRFELSHTFDAVRRQTMTPEALEAIECMELIEALSGSDVFNILVEEKAQEHFSAKTARFINKPEEYFAANPDDDKPVSKLKTVEEIFEEEAAKL
jgi:hypothetical protein